MKCRVANDENGVERATPAKTDAASYTPAAKLSGDNLYWRVQMLDDDGAPGPAVDGRLSMGDGAPGGTSGLYLPMIRR